MPGSVGTFLPSSVGKRCPAGLGPFARGRGCNRGEAGGGQQLECCSDRAPACRNVFYFCHTWVNGEPLFPLDSSRVWPGAIWSCPHQPAKVTAGAIGAGVLPRSAKLGSGTSQHSWLSPTAPSKPRSGAVCTWGCPRSRQRLPCKDSSGTEGAHNCLRCHAGCAVTRGAGHSGVEPVTTVYVALAPDSCWPVSKSSWVFAGSEPHGGPGGFRLKQNLVLLRVVKVEPPAPGLSLRPRSLPWHYSCESSSEHCPRPRGLA